MNIRVAVGDKAFHSVQVPLILFFIEGSLQHYGLKIRPCIGFGKVHRHGLSLHHARDVFVFLVFITKFIDGLATILEHPYILKARIGTTHDIGTDHIGHHRKIKSTILAGKTHTHQFRSVEHVEVLLCVTGIGHTTVGYGGTVVIYLLGVGLDDLAAYFSHHHQHLVVAVHCILKIDGGIVVRLSVGIIPFFQFHNSLHQRMLKVVPELGCIGIKICHKFSSSF